MDKWIISFTLDFHTHTSTIFLFLSISSDVYCIFTVSNCFTDALGCLSFIYFISYHFKSEYNTVDQDRAFLCVCICGRSGAKTAWPVSRKFGIWMRVNVCRYTFIFDYSCWNRHNDCEVCMCYTVQRWTWVDWLASRLTHDAKAWRFPCRASHPDHRRRLKSGNCAGKSRHINKLPKRSKIRLVRSLVIYIFYMHAIHVHWQRKKWENNPSIGNDVFP